MKKKVFYYVFFISALLLSVFTCVYPKLENVKTDVYNNQIIDPKPLENQVKDKKVIYLTFDDGPSYVITNKILDVLKKYNVKATFFVVGSQIEGREQILKRMYEEGHGIGLHTFSHKYNKIYCSDESFINEMKITADVIEKVINIRPTAIRFPGGSKNHLDRALLEKLHQEGFKVFDWNVSIADGVNPNLSSEQFFQKATKVKYKSSVLLLMHCNYDNEKTCAVLPNIIDYYMKLGYEFCTINNSTPEYYFRFK